MKINMPVTQREIPYPKGMYVVSQTDLKGVIRDANEAFVALSGFTREELMGKSHNIVRHPDVPPAIFADMWANLKAGMPWQAVVKNRCKNGDHYWVDAQVVPIIRNGEVSGYMSVRREASRQQIKEAEALFAEVQRTGKFNSIKRNPLGLATWIYGICAFSIGMFILNNVVMWLDMPEWVDRLTGILGMAALIPLPFVLYAKVFAPLAEIRKNILSLTEGDLASRYPIRMPNELGQIANSFQIMQTQWLVSIDHIKDSIRDTLQGMQHVNEESDSINRQIESQHDRVSTVAAATEEFCQAVAEVASSAADTSRAAETSGGLIQTSQQTVKAGMQAAEVVVGAVSKSHTSIAELDQAVGKIGDITKVIKEIAEQTNLLALNAAIEAARAGETGRGFAVVADEVRKLAERTAGSTQEINSMVSGIQALAGEVVASMSQAADAVQSSSGKMRESVEGLNRVTEASQLTVDMAEHIANASDQQSIAGQEVARNMEQISQLSEQNQEKLRSLKSSLEEMRVATAKIDEAVGVFKLFSR